ncbi:MAG: TIGR02147 family protein [Fibrobacteria bacterium]|nr:TIGR02147 family protein [Fibrobacteria bacterium]
MKSIFDYTNYRKYLQDYYSWAKINVRGFSHRAFLKKAGMSGPNYLKRVMEGVHKLTDNSIPKFAKALSLSESETVYFQYLVYFNQAKTLADKDKYFEVLMDLKGPYAQYKLDRGQYDYYKEWYNIAIREILSYFPYKNNPDTLGKEIAPPVSPRKVKKSIELLEGLGLIEKRSDGSYAQTNRAISTGPDFRSLLVSKFHISMAKLAAEAITRFKKEDRYFSSVSMSLSRESFEMVIRLIREFRKTVIERVSQETDPDRVCHLNMQLFPMTKPPKKKKK